MSSYVINSSVHSSKGNQLKLQKNEKWYKADFFGYEGAAEYFASEILSNSNVLSYVPYSIEKIEYEDRIFTGCVSDNFLKSGQRIITIQRLFLSIYGKTPENVIKGKSLIDGIRDFVDAVESMTSLYNFGEYLTILLEFDALILNEDRHFHNIAVIQNANGCFELCPVFDNGASLLSDMYNDYPLSKSIYGLISDVHAKPFSKSFDEQVECCQRLYGKQLKVKDFDTEKCIHEIKKLYGDDIATRISDIYDHQKMLYPEFFIQDTEIKKLSLF